MMDYDPSPDALLQPELHEPLLRQGASCTPLQLAAECARLAYLRFDVDAMEHATLKAALQTQGYARSDAQLQCFIAPETHTQAFAAYNDAKNHVIVAFRGTQSDSAKDWVTDAKFILTPLRGELKVHSGFLQAWQAVAPMLRHWLATPLTHGAKVTVCGHSLGAALATIAALELPCDSLVTLGSPRVGNQAFANRVLSSVREARRLVNCCDVVTMVPPPFAVAGGYAHVGEAVYIDRHGMMMQGVVNDIAQEADRARARGEWLLGQPAALPGTARVMLRELADHAPINYLRALF